MLALIPVLACGLIVLGYIGLGIHYAGEAAEIYQQHSTEVVKEHDRAPQEAAIRVDCAAVQPGSAPQLSDGSANDSGKTTSPPASDTQTSDGDGDNASRSKL